MQNDSNTAIQIIETVLKYLGGIITPIFVFLGIYYKVKTGKKRGAEGRLQDIVRKEQLLHSKVAERLQDSAHRIRTIDRLNRAVVELFQISNADRFLVLLAVNGVIEYKTISCIYQKSQKDEDTYNAVQKYTNTKIDSSYKEMLRNAEKYGVVNLLTKHMKGTLLGDIYLDENVQASRVYFIDRINLDEPGKDVMIYVSIATHNEEQYTARDVTRIDIMVNGSIKRYIKELTKEI